MPPLSPAIHLGADRLLAILVRYARTKQKRKNAITGYPPPAQVLGLLMNSIFLESLEVDAEHLQRINRTLELIPRETPQPDGLHKIELLVLRPSRDLGEMAAGYSSQLPYTLRFLIRRLGAQESRAPPFTKTLRVRYVQERTEVPVPPGFAPKPTLAQRRDGK